MPTRRPDPRWNARFTNISFPISALLDQISPGQIAVMEDLWQGGAGFRSVRGLAGCVSRMLCHRVGLTSERKRSPGPSSTAVGVHHAGYKRRALASLSPTQ